MKKRVLPAVMWIMVGVLGTIGGATLATGRVLMTGEPLTEVWMPVLGVGMACLMAFALWNEKWARRLCE